MTWSDTAQNYDDAKKVAEVTQKWMEQLGGSELAETASKAALAFDTVVKVSQIAGVAASLMSVKNTLASEEAVALTTVRSAMGPIGWANIALAAGVATTTAVLTGAICHYKLKADLEQPSGMESVRQFIQGVR